mmetsp:Transcript_26128/g.67361  ORF Transcript_26128/g.67361 Transcript_26128/m.67361 type:complete len:223 (-) Transcript_26128:79-747(-)
MADALLEEVEEVARSSRAETNRLVGNAESKMDVRVDAVTQKLTGLQQEVDDFLVDVASREKKFSNFQSSAEMQLAQLFREVDETRQEVDTVASTLQDLSDTVTRATDRVKSETIAEVQQQTKALQLGTQRLESRHAAAIKELERMIQRLEASTQQDFIQHDQKLSSKLEVLRVDLMEKMRVKEKHEWDLDRNESPYPPEFDHRAVAGSRDFGYRGGFHQEFS